MLKIVHPAEDRNTREFEYFAFKIFFTEDYDRSIISRFMILKIASGKEINVEKKILILLRSPPARKIKYKS